MASFEEDKTLFLQGFSADATEEDVKKSFPNPDSIQRVHMKLTRFEKIPFAYVIFQNAQDANDAIEKSKIKPLEIKDKICQLQPYRKEKEKQPHFLDLFSVPSEYKKEQIIQDSGCAETILGFKLRVFPNKGTKVTLIFSNVEDLKKALNNLENNPAYKQKGVQISERQVQNIDSTRSVFVRNISSRLTEEDIGVIFQRFGKVEQVKFNKLSDEIRKDNAVIIFENPKSVSEVFQNREPLEFYGKRFEIKPFRGKKKEFPEQMPQQYQQPQYPQQYQQPQYPQQYQQQYSPQVQLYQAFERIVRGNQQFTQIPNGILQQIFDRNIQQIAQIFQNPEQQQIPAQILHLFGMNLQMFQRPPQQQHNQRMPIDPQHPYPNPRNPQQQPPQGPHQIYSPPDQFPKDKLNNN
ncbi:RNA-binding motif protein 14b [Anaeramoeba ignava]|uniref:RNA-binding motif protein 14b n=1 Tax=Anaeramoeba ignava TaxID=1746090 RepID=A0A9Q0LQP5_ANAIG|nr:RNA-binding motif protein 14b [Anaeramoeba ignava]